MSTVRLTDLPEAYQRQAQQQLAGATPRRAEPTATVPVTPSAPLRSAGASRMSKTEARYLAEIITPLVRSCLGTFLGYEPITLRMANGHRYTPDFGVHSADGVTTLIEVKGGYRLGSYQRARLAFDQARVEFPCFRFVWAEWTKDGWHSEAEAER